MLHSGLPAAAGLPRVPALKGRIASSASDATLRKNVPRPLDVDLFHLLRLNSSFPAPHRGHTQSAGRSSHLVPGAMPLSDRRQLRHTHSRRIAFVLFHLKDPPSVINGRYTPGPGGDSAYFSFFRMAALTSGDGSRPAPVLAAAAGGRTPGAPGRRAPGRRRQRMPSAPAAGQWEMPAGDFRQWPVPAGTACLASGSWSKRWLPWGCSPSGG